MIAAAIPSGSELKRRLLKRGAVGLAFFSIPLLLIALPLSAIGKHQNRGARLLEQEGMVADASIEKMWILLRQGGADKSLVRNYHLSYRFTPQSGGEVISSAKVSSRFWSGVKYRLIQSGATFAPQPLVRGRTQLHYEQDGADAESAPTFSVRYARSDPALSEIKPVSLASGARGYFLATGIVALASLLLPASCIRGGSPAISATSNSPRSAPTACTTAPPRRSFPISWVSSKASKSGWTCSLPGAIGRCKTIALPTPG